MFLESSYDIISDIIILTKTFQTVKHDMLYILHSQFDHTGQIFHKTCAKGSRGLICSKHKYNSLKHLPKFAIRCQNELLFETIHCFSYLFIYTQYECDFIAQPLEKMRINPGLRNSRRNFNIFLESTSCLYNLDISSRTRHLVLFLIYFPYYFGVLRH